MSFSASGREGRVSSHPISPPRRSTIRVCSASPSRSRTGRTPTGASSGSRQSPASRCAVSAACRARDWAPARRSSSSASGWMWRAGRCSIPGAASRASRRRAALARCAAWIALSPESCRSRRLNFARVSNHRRLAMPQHEIGFLIFPNLTQLDFTGPLQVLSRLPGARTHIAARSLEPIPTDCGLSLLPTVTLEDCPKLDLLCVPGGFGVVDVMKDDTSLDFVRRQAASARYVTSVCVGAFVLGAAGLLRGKRATTHWAYTDLLPLEI